MSGHVQLILQVYACLADELPEEACHQLLVDRLGDHTDTAQDQMWHAAEAISLIETAAARASRTGSTDRLCASLLTALQRCSKIPFCCRLVCMCDEQPEERAHCKEIILDGSAALVQG